MSERVLIDWGVAARTAEWVGGLGEPEEPGRAETTITASEVEAACAEALGSVAAYTGLAPKGAIPLPELVDRGEWARVGIDTLALAAGPLEQRLAGQLELPGPLGAVARELVGAGTGAEAGLAVGYAARRVLGQYDVALIGPPRPARLLLVAPNLERARTDLAADPGLFARWVALHEITHVLQFEGVDWLVGHLRGLIATLLETATSGLDARRLSSSLGAAIRSRPRELVRSLLRGELVRTLASPAQRAIFDRLQATMAAIEGHAEHVMDACGEELDPGLGELRRRLDERRARRGGLGDVLARLLGLELKLRQYERGKAFCDGVVAAGGVASLALLWRSPEDLPELDELDRPRDWLARVSAPL